MIEPIIVVLALITGLGFKSVGYPPLLGYILAGFFANFFAIGDSQTSDKLQLLSDAGITLLLFTIGLKVNLKEMAAPKIWAVGSLQIVILMPVFVGIIWGFLFFSPDIQLSPVALWSIAFALSFSSTVFAVKVFDERGEGGNHHTRIAIGILVLQDLLAVIFLAASTGMVPHWWAVILLALPLIRKPIIKLIDMCGHSELLTLCGIMLAFGAAELFYFCNLKGDLGALVIGMVLAGCSKGNELYKHLINFKDLFLVSFFVSVGYLGLPSLPMIGLAVVLACVCVCRPFLYYGLFSLFGIRARTSLLASFGLFSYSEFGLIVASLAAASGWLSSDWITTMALALALSFFISVPFNAKIHELYFKWFHWLTRFEKQHKYDSLDLKDAEVLVLGMGRVGGGAYQFLREKYGNKVLGVEALTAKTSFLQSEGLNVIKGDGSDFELWENADLDKIKLILVSLSNHRENMDVVKIIQKTKYKEKLAVIARFPDELEELHERGCIAFNLYAEAGHGFAEHVVEELGLEDNL